MDCMKSMVPWLCWRDFSNMSYLYPDPKLHIWADPHIRHDMGQIYPNQSPFGLRNLINIVHNIYQPLSTYNINSWLTNLLSQLRMIRGWNEIIWNGNGVRIWGVSVEWNQVKLRTRRIVQKFHYIILCLLASWFELRAAFIVVHALAGWTLGRTLSMFMNVIIYVLFCTIICIIFTSLCKKLVKLTWVLAEAFRCHVHHFQCLNYLDIEYNFF